ncbi:MAG: aminotransferase class III-fold pyridoxal phosphate-dependent enzyme [Cyclobacteriaceae bacterium]|nr:aminotransferase class III-fold pyridoxal phosphate-dependent enzyme [Cyclobacteriaceae bacterium]
MNTNITDNLNHTIFSWTKQGGLNPIHAHTAEGVYICDKDGKRYLDFSSQLMNVNIGHGHPAVAKAVQEQMSQLSYVYPGMVTDARGQLGKRLADITPKSLTRTFFTLGGADAVESAIKVARVVTGRPKIISLYRSYHGATYGAMAAGGDPRKLAVDRYGPTNMIHVENPYFYRCPWNSSTSEECGQHAFEHLARVVKYEGPENVAAILLEGESGSSGCIKFPGNYWSLVAEFAKEHGILTIDDEVMSGFGRTGKWFAIEHHGVEPDMMCIAKGLTAGYIPLGGLVVSEPIAQFFENTNIPIGLTYSAHPVACAAANAVLQVYEDEDLINKAQSMGQYVEAKVKELADRHPSIGDFRNTGLLGCIELVKSRKTKEPVTPWNANPHQMAITNEMAAKVRELGMFTFVRWNYIFVAPPLVITEAQVDEGMEIISQTIALADAYYRE